MIYDFTKTLLLFLFWCLPNIQTDIIKKKTPADLADLGG